MALAAKSATPFDSVFPSIEHTIPTPQATPEIGSISSPGQSFGGFRGTSSIVEDALRLSRAWSTVTTALQECHKHGSPPGKLVKPALELLITRDHERQLLQDWHLNEISKRFEETIPLFDDLIQALNTWQNVGGNNSQIGRMLKDIEQSIRFCMLRPWHIDQSPWSGMLQTVLRTLQYAAYERWTALMSSIPCRADLETALAKAMHVCMQASSQKLAKDNCWKIEQCLCRLDFNMLPLHQLDAAGLGGDIAKRALATAVSDYLSHSIMQKRCFQVDWRGRKSCAGRMTDWIRNIFAPTIESAMRAIAHDSGIFTDAQINMFVDTAITNLGRNRTTALFEYIRIWPHSEGAVDDIKAYLAVNRTADKVAVCTACEDQLQRRLLHAGASTAEILGMYVHMISVFKRLDGRGVLLEKVSPVIRTYLRARQDAVNVLAESLFADPDITTEPSLCLAVTRELQNVVQDQSVSMRSLDWDDMNWMPDPIDAATDRKSSRTDDVLACVLSLFDQDELIKEFDHVLANHLLNTDDPEISSETRLLEMLKTRLDPAKLQNAEIMLKDIRDSMQFEKRLRSQTTSVPTPQEIQRAIPADGISVSDLYSKFEQRIKRTQFQAIIRLVATKRHERLFAKRGRLPQEPEDEVMIDNTTPDEQYRILSSVSWPQVQPASFTVPEQLAQRLHTAGEVFSKLSGQRRLEWRHEMSTVSIELELEDRTIVEDNLPASRAAVVKLFELADTWTSEALAAELEMSEATLQDALSFWLAQRVLYQQSPGVFAVLERLDMDIDVQDDALLAVASGNAEDAALRENAPMFEAFISNMLGNGGPKAIEGMMGITSMLKMVLPTFTYGDDEVKWLLNQMKGKGMVREDGDLWAAP